MAYDRSPAIRGDHRLLGGSSNERSTTGGSPSPTRQAAWLVAMLLICFAAAGVGGALTAQSVRDWYPTLAKPAWTPPDWLFGPVWTALYAMMAVAAWLVWRRDGWRGSRAALVLFGVQLLLNVGWSAVFFGLRQPGLAFAEIVVLWLAIAATALAFGRRSKIAGWMLAPYLAWTSFAATLNLAIWRLNS